MPTDPRESPAPPAPHAPPPPASRSIHLRLLLVGVLALVAVVTINWIAGRNRHDRAVESAVAETVASLGAKRDVAGERVRAIGAANVFDFASIRSADDVEQRLRLLDSAREANAAVLSAGERAGPELKAKLEAQGAAPEKVDRAVAQFNERYWDTGRRVYTASGQMYDAGHAVLTYLRDHWGHWAYDADAREVKLDTDERVAAYGRLQSALQDAVRAQQAIVDGRS